MKKREISAGAEKVENIARRGCLQGEAANNGASGAEQEREAAERRVQAALDKEREKKEKAERKERRRRERAEGKESKNRTPGFGGWLAAVVSLSVAVLALGAIVTVGYFDLADSKSSLTESYRVAVYEFSENVESMSTGLSKARIADGAEMQRLLTGVLVHSELAERCLGQLPCDGQDAAALTQFFNRCSAYSRSLLAKLAAGGELTSQEERAVAYMYETCERIRGNTPALIESAQMSFVDELFAANGSFGKGMEKLGECVGELPADVAPLFGAQAPAAAADGRDIGEKEAFAAAEKYFSEYKPENMRIAGRTEGAMPCYVAEFSRGGVQCCAHVRAADGALAYFESDAPGKAENYTREDCSRIARRFLEQCGYEGLKCAFVSECGAEVCAEFAAEQGGVMLYADRILVKVCKEKGEVTGLEAMPYLKNHKEREIGAARLSAETVERNAAARMDEVFFVRPALLPQSGGELLCWEVRGTYGGAKYIAFVDASTGAEAEVYVVVGTGRGEKIV